MLKESNLFGTKNKVAEAIELLRQYEPIGGYYVCFSGGKDSVVILDLVKRAGVKYEAHHHIMTIEPPELMQFIYKEYPEVINDRASKTMHQLIVEYGFPPLRQIRYCCWELKTKNGKDRFKVTGVRAEESPRRAKQEQIEKNEDGGGELRLIHDWTAAEVWEYIHSRNLPYCKLYDKGKRRIGCVFCPYAGERENIENALKYPQFVRYFITACNRAIKIRKAEGKTTKYSSGAEMFKSWIEGGRGKRLEDFGYSFDFEKEVFFMNEDSGATVKSITSEAHTISLAEFNTIILHAEKISDGQFDFANVLRGELKKKLGIDNADELINLLMTKPEGDIHNLTRLFLANFNFTIQDDNAEYYLKKFGEDYCELELIKNDSSTQSTTAIVPADGVNLPTTAPTLQQRVVKIQFHLQNMGNSAIIIGQELIECKKEVGHGEWANWLEINFKLKKSSAANFMAIAERFSNFQPVGNFGYTQMVELLALPEAETEKFVEEKAAEGTPVEKMSKRQLHNKIKEWKTKAEEKTAEAEKLKEENAKLKAEKANPVEILPSDYEDNKKEIERLTEKVDELESELANKTVEVLPPDDYESTKDELEETKKELAELKTRQKAKVKQEIETKQKMEQLFDSTEYLLNAITLLENMREYCKENKDARHKVEQMKVLVEEMQGYIGIIEEENFGNKKG